MVLLQVSDEIALTSNRPTCARSMTPTRANDSWWDRLHTACVFYQVDFPTEHPHKCTLQVQAPTMQS